MKTWQPWDILMKIKAMKIKETPSILCTQQIFEKKLISKRGDCNTESFLRVMPVNNVKYVQELLYCSFEKCLLCVPRWVQTPAGELEGRAWSLSRCSEAVGTVLGGLLPYIFLALKIIVLSTWTTLANSETKVKIHLHTCHLSKSLRVIQLCE